jgi:hypothetical protein
MSSVPERELSSRGCRFLSLAARGGANQESTEPPGDMVHLQTKKLARIAGVGKRFGSPIAPQPWG